MKKLVLLLIRFYQMIFSYDYGLMGKIFPNVRSCRYIPTCSVYGYTAIDRFGVFKGGFLALKRVIRCNPWSKHSHYDPVPDKI